MFLVIFVHVKEEEKCMQKGGTKDGEKNLLCKYASSRNFSN